MNNKKLMEEVDNKWKNFLKESINSDDKNINEEKSEYVYVPRNWECQCGEHCTSEYCPYCNTRCPEAYKEEEKIASLEYVDVIRGKNLKTLLISYHDQEFLDENIFNDIKYDVLLRTPFDETESNYFEVRDHYTNELVCEADGLSEKEIGLLLDHMNKSFTCKKLQIKEDRKGDDIIKEYDNVIDYMGSVDGDKLKNLLYGIYEDQDELDNLCSDDETYEVELVSPTNHLIVKTHSGEKVLEHDRLSMEDVESLKDYLSLNENKDTIKEFDAIKKYNGSMDASKLKNLLHFIEGEGEVEYIDLDEETYNIELEVPSNHLIIKSQSTGKIVREYDHLSIEEVEPFIDYLSLNENKDEETVEDDSKIKYVNLCPHAIKLNNGTIIEPSGEIARVSVTFTPFDNDNVCEQVYGSVTGLPAPEKNTYYIVSALVLTASSKSRFDIVAPATGHPDAKRNGSGQIESVPGFVR